MARKYFTTQQFLARGHSERELRNGITNGQWIRGAHGLYFEGAEPLNAYGRALAAMLSSDGVLSSLVAAQHMGLDSIVIPAGPLPRRRRVPVSPEPVLVNGIWCTNGLQTMVDIAPLVDDVVYEQVLESALRKELLKIDELTDLVPLLTKSRTAGSPRIKRVLALRPAGAPPTESLLETLMVQLARRTPGVPEAERQVIVNDEHGTFVARVDLAWPNDAGFCELDGEQHKDQPVHDAVRQTNVAIATGWLCGRFSWTEVRWNPVPTARRLARFIAMARSRRPTATRAPKPSRSDAKPE
jgi:very-short-patch-repair endonuclease